MKKKAAAAVMAAAGSDYMWSAKIFIIWLFTEKFCNCVLHYLFISQ